MKREAIGLIVAMAVACAIAAPAWAKKFTLTAAPSVPAANGTVETHLDRNGNTEVDIKVHNLAHPANLTPSASTYVVWFQQAGSQPRNEGELKVNDKLDGELKTLTQWKTFELIISAEADPAVKTPSGQQVMHASIQH